MPHPPAFGHARRRDFLLADGVAHLNHGGFGATPRVVLDAAAAARARMEADPTTFIRRDLVPLLRAAAGRVAGFLGGRGSDWAFVENATAGLNAVVRSVRLAPGDEIVCLSQVYAAVANMLRHRAAETGARIVTVPMPVPLDDPAPLLAALAAAVGPRTRLAVLDHVTSAAAAVLPLGEMIAVCRAAGAAVAVDGAHAIGMLPLDVPALGADWYVGNFHKWGFAAKGSAVLWCAPDRQPDTHPTAISHALGQGFTDAFDYTGTRDNSSWIAVPAALDYIESIGADAMRHHNRTLAAEAGRRLAERWNAPCATAPAFMGTMAAVRLPHGGNADRGVAQRLAGRLRDEYGISVGVTLLDGDIWIRVSAQIYNAPEDYERLATLGADLRP